MFGGSFDPPTRAHVALPVWVARAVGAARVLFVPAGVSPHKQDRPPTAALHRLEMLRLALAAARGNGVALEIDPLEVERAGPSYTVDTLETLAAARPRERLRLLIGSDQLKVFHLWRNWRRIEELAEPLVMVRPPDTAAEVLAALPPELPAERWRPRLVEAPRMEISATSARLAALSGADLAPWVEPAVADYIREHDLYAAP